MNDEIERATKRTTIAMLALLAATVANLAVTVFKLLGS
jgi:hypothetical protein